MARAGQLHADVTANAGQFKAEMKSAGDSAKVWGKEVKDSVDNAQRSFAKLAAGLTTGAAAVYIKNIITAQEETARFAQRIGASVEGLSRLEYAAKANGMAVDSFRSSMEKSINTIAEAARGTGPGVAALNELGLSAEKLKNARPETAMEALADSLSNVKNESDRVRLAIDLFGKSGAGMLDFLAGGSAGLRELAAEADRTGATVTSAMAGQAKAADDAFDRLDAAISGIGNSVASKLVPSIAAGAEEVSQFVSSNERLAKAIDVAKAAAAGIATYYAATFIPVIVRTTAAAYASVTAWGVNTAALYSYQVALARMAGASTAAAVGVTALSVAGRAATASLALLGGPLGILAIAAAGLAVLVANHESAAEATEKHKNQVADFTRELSGMTNVQIMESIRALNQEETAQRTRIRLLQDEVAAREKAVTAMAQSSGSEASNARLMAEMSKLEALRDEYTKTQSAFDATKEKIKQSVEQLKALSAAENQAAELRLKSGEINQSVADKNREASERERLEKQRLIEAERAWQDLVRDSAAVIASIETPFEKYLNQNAELILMLEKGLLTQEQFNRAQKEAADNMTKAGDGFKLGAAVASSVSAPDIAGVSLDPVEALEAEFAAKEAALASLREQELISLAEHEALITQLKKDELTKRIEMEAQAAAASEALDNLTWQKKFSMAVGFMQQIASSLAGQSKKAFEVSKKLSIAQTIIGTFDSATQAYKAMAGIPYIGPVLGAAAAAAAIAAGMANVNRIKSTQYGSSGGGAASSYGSGGVSAGASFSAPEPAQPTIPDTVTTTATIGGGGGIVVQIDNHVSGSDPVAAADELERRLSNKGLLRTLVTNVSQLVDEEELTLVPRRSRNGLDLIGGT
jgi:hypothetical protein